MNVKLHFKLYVRGRTSSLLEIFFNNMKNLLFIYIYINLKKNCILFFKRKYYCKKEGNALPVCDIQNHMVKPRTENLTGRGLVKFLMPYI